MTYYMTSPEGEKFAGYWDIEEVDEPSGFAFRDGFADADLNPDLPVSRNDYTFTDTDGALARCSPAPSTPPRTCRR